MPKRKRSATPESLDDGIDDDACSLDEKGMPIQRNAANARERARMRVLSSAFYRLKTIIPWVPRDTKLSKLDTLRLATNYISFLASTLDGEPMDVVSRSLQQPQKLTWPFIFQQMHDVGKGSSSGNNRHQSGHNNNNNNETSSMDHKKWHAMSMHEIGFDDSSQFQFKDERSGFGMTGFGSYLSENSGEI